MKLVHRFAYFGVGLFFGIILLIFFLGGKKASCSYFPNARVLKTLRSKDRVFSNEATAFFKEQKIDTSVVSLILEDGEVDFSKSNTKAEPCNSYNISGSKKDRTLELIIENCDSTATIQKAKFRE